MSNEIKGLVDRTTGLGVEDADARYLKLDQTTPQTVAGTVNSTGPMSGQKSGVFAYLAAPANTTITTANNWYFVEGTFVNDPVENFSAIGPVTESSSSSVNDGPGVRYLGTLTQYFEIDWHTTATSDHTGGIVRIGIEKNGVLLTYATMSQYIKSAGEPVVISGTCVVALGQNDIIQLVTSADRNADVVTINSFLTTISEFFD